MDNLASFYNSLLGIEIAIFGIICAVIIVFIQLLFSTYSYKHIGYILRNKYLLSFFSISAIDLTITSMCSYFLSLSNHNLFPRINFDIDEIIQNQFSPLCCILLLAISSFVFLVYVVKNISYLQPHRGIFLLAKSINFTNIIDFILEKNDPRSKIKSQINIVREKDEIDYVKSLTNEELLECINKSNNNPKKKSISKTLKKRIAKEDPLLPIRDMMIQFIKRSELSSLMEAEILLSSITKDFFIGVNQSTQQDKSHLVLYFSNHYSEILSTLLEIADKEGTNSAKKIILTASSDFSILLFQNHYINPQKSILKIWQDFADSSIDNSPAIFREIINHYRLIGENAIFMYNSSLSVIEKEDLKNILEEVFMNIGWLGERLLIKKYFEELPIMINLGYNSNFDTIKYCLDTFSNNLIKNMPDENPSIFFDALYVIIKKLIEIRKENHSQRVEELIYHFISSHYLFADEALKVNNVKGAESAVIFLQAEHSDLKNAGLFLSAKDVLRPSIDK